MESAIDIWGNINFRESLILYLIFIPAVLFIAWLLAVLVQRVSRPEQTYGSRYPFIGRIKLWGLFVVPALVFMVVALAGPSGFGDMIKPLRGNVEIVVLLDNSISMKAADIRPSRLEIAKKEILRLEPLLKDGDKVGLFTFGKTSRRNLFLTRDLGVFFEQVSAVNFPKSEGFYGDETIFDSDFATTLEHIFQSLDRQDASSEGYARDQRYLYRPGVKTNRMVLIFSDGDDQFLNYAPIRPEDILAVAEEKAEYKKKLADVADEYRKRGLKIYPVGVGTRSGVDWFSLLEGYRRGIDYPGYADFEEEWRRQITRLDRNNLSSLAKSTGAVFSGHDWTVENAQGNVGSYLEYVVSSNRRPILELVAEEEESPIWQYCLLVAVGFLVLGIATYPFRGYLRSEDE